MIVKIIILGTFYYLFTSVDFAQMKLWSYYLGLGAGNPNKTSYFVLKV